MTETAELTIEQALSDPLITLVMRADGVDAEALRRQWTALGATLRSRPGPAAPLQEFDRIKPLLPIPFKRGHELVADCICAGWARTANPHASKAGPV